MHSNNTLTESLESLDLSVLEFYWLDIKVIRFAPSVSCIVSEPLFNSKSVTYGEKNRATRQQLTSMNAVASRS
jgi:hypothetical protein